MQKWKYALPSPQPSRQFVRQMKIDLAKIKNKKNEKKHKDERPIKIHEANLEITNSNLVENNKSRYTLEKFISLLMLKLT